MPIYSTACPRNCYSTCSFNVLVEDGKIINIEPHPANRATPEGICLKGLSYVERANSSDRIIYPLKKIDSRFKKIGWVEALDTISEKLLYFKNEFGPHSILFYESSGMSGLVNGFSTNFWKLFGGVTTTYGNLCWPAGLEAVRLTLGENKHNVPWDIENAKLILLWGKNPAETNIQQMIFIEKAQSRGAKLIVIDPRRTPSSERADLLIQPRPGTDAALALTVANILINEGWIDKKFINSHVYGFEKFKESIKSWTVEKAAKITDIPIRYIKQLTEDIGTKKPMTLVPGYGVQRFTNGGQTIRSLLALSILTGNVGKPGACFHYANLQSYVFDAVKEPLSYYPFVNPDDTFRRTISKAKLGEDMLTAKDPELKMIWVERGNPVAQNPDTNKILKAFRKLQFRVVVDQFKTDTAKDADIILPAKNMFEQSDLIGSYWNPYVQLKPKVVEPSGEVKPETEIYFEIAKRLGYRREEILKYLPEPGNETIENFLKLRLQQFPQLSWEELKEKPIFAPGLEEIAFSDITFKTSSGKIELYSESAREKWGVDPLPSFDELVEGDSKSKGKYPLQLLSPNTKDRIHSQFGNLKLIRQFAEETEVMLNVSDAMERGIKNKDSVRLYNDRGDIITRAKLNFSLKKGCAVYFNGLWLSEGGTPNLLSEGRETDMGFGSAFHDTLVEVEKVNSE
jgi:anaerobic selenocysteine-containing dehydrogenase